MLKRWRTGSTTLRCAICAGEKRFDQVKLLATRIDDSQPRVRGELRPLVVTEVTDPGARSRAWHNALAGTFPTDGERNYWLACDLDHRIAIGDTLRICVIGLTLTGKTHYLAALFQLLLGNKVPHVRISVRSAADHQRIHDNVVEVFDYHRVLPATAWDHVSQITPFSFHLMLDQPDGTSRTVGIELYDFPGEFSDGWEKTMAYAPFVQNADALVFFINPLSFAGLSEGMLESDVSAGDSPGVMLDNYARLWRSRRDLPNEGAVPPAEVPVAVVLNRADVLVDHPKPEVANAAEAALREPRVRDLADLPAAVDSNSRRTRGLLEAAGEGGLLDHIEGNFDTVRYFMASPLGDKPTKRPGEDNAWRRTPLTQGGIALPLQAIVYRLLDRVSPS